MRLNKTVRHFLIAFIPSLLLILVLLYFIDREIRVKALDQQIQNQSKILQYQQDYAMDFFEPVLTDVYYLTNKSLKLSTQDITRQKRLQLWAEDFALFSKASRLYDQIRILDSTGQELVRIDYKAGEVSAVNDTNLQDKSHRRYYREGASLKQNEIYISPVDLNMEQGKIEVPYKPVVRVAMPISEAGDEGLLIVNYNVKEFLSRLQKNIPEGITLNILNKNGYWLYPTDDHEPFGFLLKDRKDNNMSGMYPEAWTEINDKDADSGSVLTDDGLYVYRRIHYKELVEYFNQTHNTALRTTSDNYILLIVHTGKKQLNTLLTNHRTYLLLILLMIIFFSLSLWAIISKIKERQAYNHANELVDELRKNQNTLIEKNSQLESFVRVASHDLREPLATIKSIAQTILKEYKEDEKIGRYLSFIINTAVRMDQLTQAVLDYAVTGRSSEVTLIDCNDLLNHIQHNLKASIERTGAKLIIGELPMIYGYELELTQLFQNLISNAIKYSRKDRRPEIRITSETKDHDGFIVRVADNGIGIPVSEKDRIFNVFHRLKTEEKHEGVGIGLSICKKIVELHHGKIWVEPTPGGGSTFVFTLKNLSPT